MRAVVIAALSAFALAATPLNGQTPDPPRAFLLFIDDLHLDFRQTPRTRALMQRLLRDVARPGDIWAVASTGTSSVRLSPTRDVAALHAAVSRVTGNSLKPSERLLAKPGSNTANEVRHRADVAYGTAVEAIEGLATAAPNVPVTVFYISDGYDTRVVERPQPFIDAAKRARAAVITLVPWNANEYRPSPGPDGDWRALRYVTQGSLATLAAETGGATIFTAEDIDPVLQRFAKP